MRFNSKAISKVIRRGFSLRLVIFFIMFSLIIQFSFTGIRRVSAQQNDGKGIPIIIVPGIMGSRLYDDKHQLVWLEDSQIDILFKSLPGIGQKIKFSSENNKMKVRGNYNKQNHMSKELREYGTRNEYKAIVDFLIEEFPERDIYFFSYDWRLSVLQIADKLNKLILCVTKYGPGKVDIVAHSMGGLVASAFMKKFADGSAQQVGKIITCGTPYEGSPKTFYVLLPDRIQFDLKKIDKILLLADSVKFDPEKIVKIFFDIFSRVFAGLTFEVKCSFPSMQLLVPSLQYMEKYPFVSSYVEGDEYSAFSIARDNYAEFLSMIFSSNKEGEKEFNFDIYNYITSDANDIPLTHYGKRYNYLASLPNTYFIVGINQDTISSLGVERNISNPSSFCSRVEDIKIDTNGDGTVPYDSATMMGVLPHLLSRTGRYFEIAQDHGGTINHYKARSEIKRMLEEPTTASVP
ncbi:MAG: alpha/beta hydrolase [Clostridiaceae bacterium]|nr:alpha/beta hydrolase [Clostridiaceae bacterium]